MEGAAPSAPPRRPAPRWTSAFAGPLANLGFEDGGAVRLRDGEAAFPADRRVRALVELDDQRQRRGVDRQAERRDVAARLQDDAGVILFARTQQDLLDSASAAAIAVPEAGDQRRAVIVPAGAAVRCDHLGE